MIAMFKRKQKSFHNVHIIAIFLFVFFIIRHSEHCSLVSESFQSAKAQTHSSLAVSKKVFFCPVGFQKTWQLPSVKK